MKFQIYLHTVLIVVSLLFTVGNGLKLVGTYTGNGSSGSLPAGIAKIASGSYTPTSDTSTQVNIQHGFGEMPDFVTIMIDEQVNTEDYNKYLVWEVLVMQKFKNSGSTTVNDGCMYRRYSSNGTSFTGSATTASGTTYVNTTSFGIAASSSYMLKSGVKYKWVAGTFA